MFPSQKSNLSRSRLNMTKATDSFLSIHLGGADDPQPKVFTWYVPLSWQEVSGPPKVSLAGLFSKPISTLLVGAWDKMILQMMGSSNSKPQK